MNPPLTFVVPGDITTRTGGYEYDRRLIAAMRVRGWTVDLCQLGAGFPYPSAATRADAAAALARVPEGSVVVMDGLAAGVLPDELLAVARRLNLIALVHHPLALETGIAAGDVAGLFESERRALGAVRHVVVTSPATASRMADYGVNAARLSVVVPGTDRAPLSPQHDGVPVKLLCVASVVPRKGHELLLTALATLEDLPWHLTCGGSLDRDVVLVKALREQLRRSGLADRVVFAGELSAEQLDAHYAGADVFVLPTLYEGYGMVVAEAIARGLPVVASDTGGIADLLHEEAGLVVPPGDLQALTAALREVIAQPDRRLALAAGARRVREVLPSWDAAAAALETVVWKVANA